MADKDERSLCQKDLWEPLQLFGRCFC